MMTYNVTSIETRIFTLTQNDRFVGRLTYDKWFSFQSSIELPGQAPFTIESKGFDWSTATVVQDGNAVIDFKLTWNGQFVVNMKLDGIADHFLFRQKGIMDSKFVLLTSDGADLFVVKPDCKGNRRRLIVNQTHRTRLRN